MVETAEDTAGASDGFTSLALALPSVSEKEADAPHDIVASTDCGLDESAGEATTADEICGQMDELIFHARKQTDC